MRLSLSHRVYNFLWIYFILGISVVAEYRSYNGVGNNVANSLAGSSGTPYFINEPITQRFDNSTIGSMLQCPGNYINISAINCTNPLQIGQFPLPRCISNLANSLHKSYVDYNNISYIDSLKSKRKSSHLMTFWIDFLAFDIVKSIETGENYNNGILIPNDDKLYLSYGVENATSPPTPALQFNRTYSVSRGTVNEATSFLDGSSIYGLNETNLNLTLRDHVDLCKMRMNYTVDTADGKFGYLPRGENGQYLIGHLPKRGGHVFTNVFHVIFIREHNRKCDELRKLYGNSLTDEEYFQEARKWVIALLQVVQYREYLPIIMGTTLPTYTAYNSTLTPGLDYFFVASTFRYGHSEASDSYQIVNQNGEPESTLMLRDLQLPDLIEIYGVPTAVLSLSLQRQEELDILYSDFMRAQIVEGNFTDIASIDHLRSRDHGMPMYNDVRTALGLTRANTWSDITKDVFVQKRLQSLYTSIDLVEAYVGGLAEDHLQGSNFGQLFQTSMIQQWSLIRDSDRFWYESPDAGFTSAEIDILHNTTLSDIVLRNTPVGTSLPQNLWFVQPRPDLNINNITGDQNDSYPPLNVLTLSNVYKIQWKMISEDIYLKMTMLSDTAWFGFGFNSLDGGMIGTDFLIVSTINSSNVSAGNYHSDGYRPPIKDDYQFVEVISCNVSKELTQVEIKRPLNAPGKLPISNKMTNVIYAWNPSSNYLSYHGGNRNKALVNFFSGGAASSSGIGDSMFLTRLAHGISMALTWSVLFPASIFIVRYMKHNDNHMKQHRNIQIFGSVSVFTFGSAAMAISQDQQRTLHGVLGITLYTGVFLQITFGALTIWGLASVESANHGIFSYIKTFHLIVGTGLMILAAVNIYLGIGQLNVSPIFTYIYFTWLGILVLLYICTECWYKYNSNNKLFKIINDPEVNNKRGRLRNEIPNEVYENLPTFTWKMINERIIGGALLVVAENLVFDIRKWIYTHPGGVKILQRVIGTDISGVFFNDKNLEIKTDEFKNKDSVHTVDLYEEGEDQNKKVSRRKSSIKRRHTIADTMDRINVTLVKDLRIVMHSHSKFATAKLASMVIGKLEKTEFNEFKKDSTSENIISSSAMLPRETESFKRYVLVNKDNVTGIYAERPVKKFIFQVIDPNDSVPKITPGDYIEIMCHIEGQVVIRCYNLFKLKSPKCFSIIVKIYKDGLMSTYLDKLLDGFEIKVRGPFGIDRRVDELIPRPLPNSNPLLNPDSVDGCWDTLFMLCGGSGLSPMLQLIDYHFEHEDRDFKLYLLFANEKLHDIILKRYLDKLEIASNGKLKVTHILKSPPKKWDGLIDHVDEDIIFDWISKNYTPKPPNPPKPSENIYFDINYQNFTTESPRESIEVERSSQADNRTEYMSALARDKSGFKFVSCGPLAMLNVVNEILENMKFPEEKFIIIR
ncbi:25369_t:CDS:10 [Dentiscutata erythropus]|uniref:25369_t:CDS:1 n=1 Tax=Dentiscutata erythropus TaxID=1348616 RepID=A0A9N9D6K4_9GLOM|nr:25369_t:CDS:10 [Dentiscutata erythropus]